MSDVIKLLPDFISNQIAAGEVVQRPASVVKELLENAIDAKASKIVVRVKDSGKTSIELYDNGVGMSETDARLCFERHATSKIKQVNDLLKIQTKGFRGEALASIAAISHVELITKRKEDEIGVRIINKGNKITTQEPTSCNVGTSFIVRNLFFNTPARRNFLKSDKVEFKHIYDEFLRVALVHHNIEFTFYNNQKELCSLNSKGFKERIVNLFGERFNKNLVPIEESVKFLNISGFIGKPEISKKTRREQFFFVNDRFIRSPYLGHAISSAYKKVLPSEYYPVYFLKFQIDAALIDINIHPTKTEIKFEDERAVYAILESAVKRALGKFNISPVIEFEKESFFDIPTPDQKRPIKVPNIPINPEYNPFKDKQQKDISNRNWDQVFKIYENTSTLDNEDQKHFDSRKESSKQSFFQFHNAYIIKSSSDGLEIIHQSRAHQKILFKEYYNLFSQSDIEGQSLIYPISIEIDPLPRRYILSLKKKFASIGVIIKEDESKSLIVIKTLPNNVEEHEINDFINEILSISDFKDLESVNFNTLFIEKLCIILARKKAIRTGIKLTQEEMQKIIDRIYTHEEEDFFYLKKPVRIVVSNKEIFNKFK